MTIGSGDVAIELLNHTLMLLDFNFVIWGISEQSDVTESAFRPRGIDFIEDSFKRAAIRIVCGATT